MTGDPWDGPVCPACKGKGEVVFTRGNHWMSIECVDCQGTGLADAPSPPPRYRADGYRIPEDDEEYDPDIHGPIPSSPWRRTD
jgi:hypothetical protein